MIRLFVVLSEVFLCHTIQICYFLCAFYNFGDIHCLDKDESLEVFVGDVTSYTLHNLFPGTTYDVKVYAQYDGGLSGALTGQGTTRTCLIVSFMYCFVLVKPLFSRLIIQAYYFTMKYAVTYNTVQKS